MIRILTVDDDPSILKALKLGLGSKDMEVDVAENGADGITLGTLKQYDVLIADLCLPDMNGLELIEQVKRRSPEIVSIVITGNPVDEELRKAIGQQADGYLEKPLDMKQVKGAIRRGIKDGQERE
ncbi:MAG: response regulator [Deltaproteobacteria bacterium]|nr:response regulator [Deltaproteobacteria bacterium]